MKKLEITIEPEDSDVRIDKWISDTIPDFSRSYIQKCISEGCISVNGKTACKSSTKLCTGDELVFDVPDASVPDIEPEDIPLDILYVGFTLNLAGAEIGANIDHRRGV